MYHQVQDYIYVYYLYQFQNYITDTTTYNSIMPEVYLDLPITMYVKLP